MEEQVLELLRATQLSAAQPRMAAELQLKTLQGDDRLPLACAAIGAHADLPVADRLAALLALKHLVNVGWSPALQDFAGKNLVSDQTKVEVRRVLLGIIYQQGGDTKVVAATAAVVAAIASADFPEEWSSLLDSLLEQVPRGADEQTQAILVVLAELVDGGLDEDAFYRYAQRIFDCLHGIVVDGSKRLMVRAHAVNVFRSSLDFVDNLKLKETSETRAFAQGVCTTWSSFFLDALREALPAFPSPEEEESSSNPEVAVTWRGVVALKIQVVLALARIQNIYADMMPAEDLFTVCWDSLQAQGPPYNASYVEGERQGGLINQYQLSYTLDFLVIEEIDYLSSLLSAPQVKRKLDGMDAQSVQAWISSVLGTLVAFSSITSEAEQMWELNFNTFLSEESFSEVNNSPRTVCASFVWKVVQWFPQPTLASLLDYVKIIFSDANTSWRPKEAALFILQQAADEFKDMDGVVTDPSTIGAFIEATQSTLTNEQQFLRARAHSNMATMVNVWLETPAVGNDLAMTYAQQALTALDADDSEIVKAACIRVLHTYLTSLPSPQGTALQSPVIAAIARFLDSQNLSDLDENIDLIDVILQTVRDAVLANPLTCREHQGLDLLLLMVKHGAARDFRSNEIIEEAFEHTAAAVAQQGPESYAALCAKVLPSLVAAFDVEDPSTAAKATTLTDVSAAILKVLAEHAAELRSLPPGFVAAALPRLCRVIVAPDADVYRSQTATLCIRHMLLSDAQQVFAYREPDSGKTGLEVCFLVIGHLLGPQVDDVSAAEVGALAGSVVEQAGPAALGSSMHELLRILVARLATAEHLALVQSLVSVFARLALLNTVELLDFLAGLQLEAPAGVSALQVVLTKWLENASAFAGFDAVRQSTQALAAIHRVHDVRLPGIECNGDLIPDTSTRIKTRSMAKKAPIRYTRVPVPLKLVKVLVQELIPYSEPSLGAGMPLRSPGLSSMGSAKRTTAEQNGANGGADSDGEWESDDDGEGSAGGARADDATQDFLVGFFKAEGQDPRFQELYSQLTDDERTRCHDAVEGWDKMMSQRAMLSSRQ